MSAESKQSGRIQILPPHLINRIAAGEVVERPASVVKELVENALDAGATRIDIMASAGGRTIRVADNGGGMSPENAALAFYNHATSKIKDAEDLDRITTLGFRGEALASIGSISRLTCLTRTPDAPKGTKITLDEQGEPILSETGCAPGTIMEVADLFYNTPARLKFLKRAATELGHIEEIVQMLALSHPEVRFSLSINGKKALETTGSGQLHQTLDEIFNLKRDGIRMLPVTAEDNEAGLRLAGFASEPGVMKSSKRWLMTFVNGRHVKCGILQKTIEAAYESLLPHGKYPVCVLFLNMPPQEVDVNVHPAKREVRYAASQSIFGFVRSGIRDSLMQQGISFEPAVTGAESLGYATRLNDRLSHTTSLPAMPPQASGSGYSPSTAFRPERPLGNHRVSGPAHPRVPSEPQSVQAALNFYQPAQSEEGVSPQSDEITPPSDAFKVNAPSRFKVIGQLFNTYILLETLQGLMVVDQHIASERTFFEALSLNLSATEPAIQHLVTGQPLSLAPTQRELLIRHQDEFTRLGFLYTITENAATLTGYPLIFAGRDRMFESGGLFENLLAQLEETGEMKPDLDLMIATLACHSAVRAGDPLSHAEMQTVVERWLECKLPWTCPHGRPIAHTIGTHELNHFFHRPSLPVNAL